MCVCVQGPEIRTGSTEGLEGTRAEWDDSRASRSALQANEFVVSDIRLLISEIGVIYLRPSPDSPNAVETGRSGLPRALCCSPRMKHHWQLMCKAVRRARDEDPRYVCTKLQQGTVTVAVLLTGTGWVGEVRGPRVASRGGVGAFTNAVPSK